MRASTAIEFSERRVNVAEVEPTEVSDTTVGAELVQRPSDPATDEHFAMASRLLGQCLTELGRYPEAEGLLRIVNDVLDGSAIAATW